MSRSLLAEPVVPEPVSPEPVVPEPAPAGQAVPGPVVVEPGRLVVLLDEDGSGTGALLADLAGPGALLLPAPPGDDWDEHDVVGDLAPAALLAPLGYTAPLDREMWMVSAGERQRVRLARALAAPAEVLLLHEPSGYLDGHGVRALATLLEGGTAVVLTTDERLAAAADVVHRVVDGAVRA